jgi:hypothetical protein
MTSTILASNRYTSSRIRSTLSALKTATLNRLKMETVSFAAILAAT